MATWFAVKGTTKDTGIDTTILVEADDAAQAQKIACIRGLRTSTVRPTSSVGTPTQSVASSSIAPILSRANFGNLVLVGLLVLAALAAGSAGTVVLLMYVSPGTLRQPLTASKQQMVPLTVTETPNSSTAVSSVSGSAVSVSDAGTRSSEQQRRALAVLKRLQAKLEVGMTWPDYSRSLTDTWADIKPLLESPGSSSDRQLTECLIEAAGYYKSAAEGWSREINPETDDLDISSYNGYTTMLLRQYQDKLLREYSWQMAEATIARAEAIMAGDTEQEARRLGQVRELLSALKKERSEAPKQPRFRKY